HAQPAELMEPTDRSFDDPAIHAQTTAVGGATLGQFRLDPAIAQLLSLPLIVESPVAHRLVRAPAGPTRRARGGGGGTQHGGGQVGVGRGGRDRVDDQGHTLAVGDDRVFAPRLRAVYGAGAGLLTSAHGADVPGVDDEPLEVDPVGPPEVGQQDRVDPVPGAGGLPVAQAIPTGHAATAAHLLRQVLPGDAGLEEEDDPGEDLAVVEEGSAALGVGRMRREERLDQLPEFVRQEWLGHDAALSSRANGVSNAFRYAPQSTGRLLGCFRVSYARRGRPDRALASTSLSSGDLEGRRDAKM